MQPARAFISVRARTGSSSWDRTPCRSKIKRTIPRGKTPPGLFIEALQKFMPALEERDLRWAYSGIRPCVMAVNGGKSDFIIAADCENPLLINLVGIESPGLSAALAIARYVRELPCLQRLPEFFEILNVSGLTTPSIVEGALAPLLPCAIRGRVSCPESFVAARRRTLSSWGPCREPGIAGSVSPARPQTRRRPLE